MVFHDQSCDISEPIAKLRRDLSNLGIDPDHSVHMGPIIRREKEYEFMPIDERRRILNSMVTFIRHCKRSNRSDQNPCLGFQCITSED